jgi:DNA topoisomerase III
MRLFLAEKPSQANDIANVLGVKRRGDGFIEVTGGDKVTFARGHFYELAEPQEYQDSWGGYWRWEQLPMLPDKFKMKPVRGAGAQLKVIKDLLKAADTCVIATDAGREGELIAREILEEAKFKGKVLRFWTSSLTPKDIAAKLKTLLDGSETYPLFEAATARRNSDWAHGLNITRAATLASQHRGDYYPVGRVQTPTLAMVVRRNEAIKNFKPVTYYELEAVVRTAKGAEFKMLHAPDEEKRITEKSVAEQLVNKAQRHQGPIRVENASGKESPPLPYSMPQLQKDANRAFKFSPKKTLELAQKLYEKKAATYPRTDCQYLAASQKDDVPEILSRLRALFSGDVSKLQTMGVTLRDSTFNDAKLTDHHGIIPTSLNVSLEGEELQLFTLIAQRFLRTLAPDCLFNQTKLSLDANGVLFKASGRAVTSPGWTGIKLLSSETEDDAE